jgi:sulfur carrier protein
MQITLNGQPHPLDGPTTRAALLDAAGYAERKVAVEVNLAVVPDSFELRRGDRRGPPRCRDRRGPRA